MLLGIGCANVPTRTKILGTLDISGPPRIFLIAPVGHDLIAGAFEDVGLTLGTSLRDSNLVVEAQFGDIRFWGPFCGPVRALKLLVRDKHNLKAVIVGRHCEDEIIIAQHVL